MTKRTSGLSMPMPKAMVAQMTNTLPQIQSRCTLDLRLSAWPAWYGSALIPEIGTDKTADEQFRLGHVQLLFGVDENFGRGRGIGSEVVAPLGYAVGLVDHEPAQQSALVQVVEQFEQFRRRAQSFRSDVDELDRRRRLERQLRYGHISTQCQSWYLQLVQLVHLVFNERLQRRDDHGHAGVDHRRQLVAKTLASAGWHQNEAVIVEQNGIHCSKLLVPKTPEAEHSIQRSAGGRRMFEIAVLEIARVITNKASKFAMSTELRLAGTLCCLKRFFSYCAGCGRQNFTEIR
ncbi:hypothetical protein T4A_1359 [Trichinella pseudospiralis]|uniref:Uncharacterized protein n=1 Tax=Trichinella pseudospiralis TaxID=6337 RepID=A0A0V1DY91_TRIPS|nr:hypothetical protein T4A_1359 [Trichinella pseudospiralis]KRZ35951.1 hypothetical protein T4C_4917 [Trichinella pseudospiralis]